MKLIKFAVIACFFLIFAGCQDENPTLTIEGGKVQGVETGTPGIKIFKGIPYAAAPTVLCAGANHNPLFRGKGLRFATRLALRHLRNLPTRVRFTIRNSTLKVLMLKTKTVFF